MSARNPDLETAVSEEDLGRILRSEIQDLAPGTRLPTVREMMQQYGVTLHIAQKALQGLKADGLATTHVGRGTFVSHDRDPGLAGADSIASASKTDNLRVLTLHHLTASHRGDVIAHSLHDRLQQNGHRSISVAYGDVATLEQLLGRGEFDFCVIQPRRSVLPVRLLDLIRTRARHVVVEGRILENLDVDVVVRDRRASVAIALGHLLELGHRRVMLLTEDPSDAVGYSEIEGLFRMWQQASGVGEEWSVCHVPLADTDNGADYGAVTSHLESAKPDARPTAMLVSGRFDEATLRDVIQKSGLNIPDDLSVVHLRSATSQADDGVGFTTVGRSAEQVVATLQEHIAWRAANPKAPPRTLFDRPTLTVRGSSKAPAE